MCQVSSRATDLPGDNGCGELGVENEVDGLAFDVFGEARVGHGNGKRKKCRGGSTTEPTTPHIITPARNQATMPRVEHLRMSGKGHRQ